MSRLEDQLKPWSVFHAGGNPKPVSQQVPDHGEVAEPLEHFFNNLSFVDPDDDA